jgi:hypothetical protein
VPRFPGNFALLLKVTRIIIIFLLSGILSQSALKVAIFLDYSLNREYITLTYCENKKKPSSKCHGKCYMMKKLNEGQKKEIPSSRSEQVKYDIQLFSEQSPPVFFGLFSLASYFTGFSNSGKTSSYSNGIFHPPC